MSIPGPINPVPTDPRMPQVDLPPGVWCSAGTEAGFEVTVTHRGTEPALLTLTVLGLDTRWAPEPATIGPLDPGQSAQVTLTLVPERGALGARYPFVVAAEARSRRDDRPVMGVGESVLTVDARERLVVAIVPPQVTAVFGKRADLQITNPGSVDRALTLTADDVGGAVLRLSENSVLVPAGATSTVRGRIKVRHPRLFGSGGVHAVGVTVRDAAAPEHAGGTVRSRPLIRNGLRAGVILGLVLALWVAAAVVFIPMLSDRFTARNKVNSATASAQTTGTAPTGTAGTGATGTGSNAPGTADSDANGTGPGSADGDTDGSGDTGVPGAGAASGGQTRLAGTITGPVSTGVIVKVESTSLADAANAGAAPADTGSSGQGLRDAMAAIGKVPASALTVAPTDGCPAAQTTKTGSDGAFAFSCLTSRGFYLVTFAHQGFSEQRFIVDGSTLADAEPMKVVLSPDNGKLSGTVTGPDGPVGAATVAITDGTLSLTTSTVSRGGQGTAGSWAVTNLSTPGTYLITISAPGLGTVSMLRTLKAGGTATADATMKAGVATILGTISGTDEFGVPGPLGGVTVTATDGTTTRTATTVTTGSVGSYALPDLPSPGSYTLTVAGNGFQTATRVVDIPEGAGGVQADVSLDRTNGTVAGTVNAKEGGTLAGVGLTLTGKDATYKTISQTSPKGQFSFTGVTPGEYVLTADLFGRVPASVNVTVTAAGTTTANLTMASDNLAAVVRTSDIAVRVVDNRSGAALRCDRQPVGEHKGCLVSISGLVPEHPGTDDPDPRPVAVKEAGSLLQHTWPDSPTLPAGLYQLTVSAPGFESAQVAVQVQEGVTATAPEVRLQPLGMVAGTVTTRVGTPADPSCAVAFRTSTEQAEAPTRCTVTARPGQKPNKTCEATAPSGTTVFDCAVVDPAKGTYSLPGLSHGGYQIRIIPTDPEYQATEPASVQLGFGEDATVNAVLDRLGRLTVTTLAPDLATSSLSPAGGAEVVVTPATGARPGLTTSGTTSAKGEFQATGLLGRYTVVASGTAGRGTVVVPSVGLNQSSTVTVVLTRAIGPVVGRVTTTVDAVTRPVHGAEATVTGVSGFNGSTAIIGTAVVTTDANGCFAIVPAGWGTEPVASTAAECPAVAGSAVTVADADGADVSFVTRPLTIDIGRAGTRTQARVFSDVLASAPDAQGVRSLPAMIVSAQPSVFGRHTITGRSADGTAAVELSTLVFTITRKPAGAGDVTISAQSGGALTFRDSTQDKDNAVVPGRYTVVARDRGFADASFVLTCELGEQCVLTQDDDDAVDDNLVLFQLPTMTGELTLSALPPGKSSGYIDDAKVVPVSAPPAAGTVKVDLVNSACSAGAGDPCRIMEFHDSKQNVGLAVPGTYVFSVALQGFADQQISVTCGTDFRHPCTSLSLELGRYPKFGGTVVLSPTTFPDGSAPSRDDVRVDVLSKPNSGGSVAIDVDAGGVMHWTDTTLPAGLMAPGTYTLQFTLNGYRIDPVTFTCPTTAEQCTLDGAVGEDDPPSVQTMLMLPSGSGQVLYDYSPPDVAVPFTDAAVTVAGPAGTSNLRVRLDETGTLVWTDPVIGIAGLTQPGHYSIGIQIPGYSAVTVTLDCAFGKVCTSTTPTATRMPEVDGTASLAGGGDLALLKTATFEVKGAGASVTLTSDDTGKLTWQEAGWPTNLIRPGTYQITPRLSGYDAEALTFTCTAPTPPLTAAPTCKETLAVKFYLAGHFEISLQDQAGQAVTGATLTLSGTRITTVTARGTVNPQVFGPMPTLPAATYTIKVAAPGFRFLTYDADSTAVVCTGSTNGLRLQSGGTTACKITLSPAGTILGKVLSRVTATPPVTDSALFGATVTACLLNASSDSACDPKAPSFPATSDSDGLVAVTGNADTEGLGPGTWLVTASSPGAAKVSGTVQITDDYAMTEPPAGSIDPLTIKDGRVQLILEVTPIDLTVTPQGALGAAVLPAGTYTLSGANGHWTCVVPTPDPDDGQPCTINTTTSRFTFTGVNPGTYDLTGTAPNPARPTFQTATIPVTVQLAVDSALATQQVALPLTMRSSVLTIRVLRTTTDDTDWVSGATVVVSHQNQTAPAQDLNGKDLTTGAGGPVLTRDPADPKHAAQVAFPDVEDATYTVWVTVPGYAPMSAAVSLIAANNPTPPAQIFTLSRAARSIVVALASTAAGTVSFEGASVTLHQTAGPGGTTPTDSDITGLTVSGGFVSASQVPTGVWQVRVVDRQPGGPSAPPAAWAAVSLGTITVPNLTSPTDIAPVTGSQLIGQGQVNLSVSWAKNTCTDTSGPAAGSTIKVRIANGGNNIEVPLTVAASGNSYTATGSVLLPGRSSAYTWTTEDLPAGWTDATGSFSITVAANAVGGSVPPVSSSGTAKPATVPAGITLTVSGAGTLPSATVTATRTGSPDTAGPLTYGTPTAGTTVGTASLCLAPVAGWKLSVASGSILLPDKTNQTVAESGTSIFDFPGATLTPTVVLDTVTGRTSDTRTVAVDVIRAGSPIWHDSAALTGTTPWTGSTLILPSGSYTVRGTPPAADAFDPGSGTVDLATTHTVTATLPYVKAMFTVAVTTSTDAVAVGASVSLDGGAERTVDSAGKVLYADLAPGTHSIKATLGTTRTVSHDVPAGVSTFGVKLPAAVAGNAGRRNVQPQSTTDGQVTSVPEPPATTATTAPTAQPTPPPTAASTAPPVETTPTTPREPTTTPAVPPTTAAAATTTAAAAPTIPADPGQVEVTSSAEG